MKLLLLASLCVLAVSGRSVDGKPEMFYMADMSGKLHPAIIDRSIDTSVKADVNTDVNILLWTRQNPNAAQELFVGDAGVLQGSHFSASRPTKIFAHGFTMNGQDEKILAMRDAFLSKEDCNFISIDWEVLAAGPNYFYAASNVQLVGVHTGHLIDFLIDNGAPLSSFHVIGFSLGAHVAGYAGATVTAGNVPRVTGLDPALPEFSFDDPASRLDTSDGAFVDVIHTNSGTLLQGGLSFVEPLGHVDFYPNGGNAQPGCTDYRHTKADLADLINGCSHGRAPLYFTESITGGTAFRATQCGSWADFDAGLCSGNAHVNMGEPVSSSTRGVFYLYTNAAAPFALG